MENVETEHSSSASQSESGTSKQSHLSSTHCSKNSDVETAGPSWMSTSEIPYFSNNLDNLNSKIDACNVPLGDYNLSSELQDRLLLKSSKETVVNGTTEPENHLNDGDKENNDCCIKYVQYESELQMPFIMKIIQKDLSEPYSIYTYRYFIHKWPKLCFLAMCGDKCVGAIVCKLDIHRKVMSRGYIAMLAVDQNYRNRSIGSTLVKRAIREMIVGGADEVVLETEVTNKPALRLYEALGFVRDKRLFRYYLNGVDALRLKLWIR